MKVMTKFVINRNDNYFCYAEKLENKKEKIYRVYFDNEHIMDYSEDIFELTFELDARLTIETFVRKAESTLMYYYYGNEELTKAYEVFKRISYNMHYNKNKKNPAIPAETFVKALTIYNKNILKYKEEELDYLSDYNLIKGLNQNLELEISDSLASSYNHQNDHKNENSYEKGIERTRMPKYDI